jgi:hypothetical protein
MAPDACLICLLGDSFFNQALEKRQGGSDDGTRPAGGYIIYDGWCNRARRGADSTVVVAPQAPEVAQVPGKTPQERCQYRYMIAHGYHHVGPKAQAACPNPNQEQPNN